MPSRARKRKLASSDASRLLIYCDEAGNSGPNLVDEAQPVYVIGGWAIPYRNQEKVLAVVKEEKSRLAPNADELKGSRLLSRDRVQRGLKEFIENVTTAGAWPMFAIFEKRFWIAGKVVECLLDPYYNTRASWSFYNNLEAKKSLANQIWEFPLDRLHEFAEVLRNGNFEQLGEIVDALRRVSDLQGMEELSYMLMGASENLVEIHEHEFKPKDWEHSLETVNVPAFASFLQLIEKMGRQSRFRGVEVVHDSSLEFEEGYKWVFEAFQGAVDAPFFDRSGIPFLLGLRKLISFETAHSEDSDILQAADLVASSLFRYARAAAFEEDIPSWLEEALAPVIGNALLPILDGLPAFGYLMGSDPFLDRLLAPVRALYSKAS
jgi:hypothetical protein